ncbi:MAG TPA: dihydropteroate synthase, partial [Pyrinomonadaceae bacterium]|nr:dihydropteroate synthase [Pyrinomonadaceae bacterium]
RFNSGLVLMHLRGDFDTMHKQEPVKDILAEVAEGFHKSLEIARKFAVKNENIALDVGIGFSKTHEQNLELIAKLGKLINEFSDFPMLVGTSRKSFIGKILNEPDAEKRLQGSLASAAIAVWNGAKIVRVHDVWETVQALKIVEEIKKQL